MEQDQPAQRRRLLRSDLDRLLTAQIIVAWAGERGEESRLGWWHTDLTSEFGGRAFFTDLLPRSWDWAMYQAAREAARRKDAELRARSSDADRLVSLYSLGFDLDEDLDQRLHDLKHQGRPPEQALPGLQELFSEPFDRERFLHWVQGHGDAEHTTAPVGRRLAGPPPAGTELLVRRLVAGLAPLADAYPLPHFLKAS